MEKISPTTSKASTLARIVTLHNEITEAARTSLDKAIILGGLLTNEKERLGHGNWLPWLKANVSFTDRTARNYIRCFENRDRLKSESVSDLNSAYRLLATQPDDLLRYLPDPRTLASDLSEAGRRCFEAYHTETLLEIEHGMDRLKASGNLAEIVTCKREAERLQTFWLAFTLETERLLGGCLNEIEAKQKGTA